MQQQLTCNQVVALLTYFVENKLNKQLSKDIEYHLSICPECKKKFEKLTQIMNNFSNIAKKISTPKQDEIETIKKDKKYIEFITNLSAYIDNELSEEESLRVKKYAISNPIARQDLENIYTYKKLLYTAFEKSKNESKNDYAKKIINELISKNHQQKLDPFYLLMILFTIIISVALLGVAHFFPL